MPQSDQATVRSILVEIDNMVRIMKGKTKRQLAGDLTLERAVSMTLGLIGEKANKITTQFKASHPEVEWIALRNRIVHSYEDLDFDINYETIRRKLPELKKQLKNIEVVTPQTGLSAKKRSRPSKGRNGKPLAGFHYLGNSIPVHEKMPDRIGTIGLGIDGIRLSSQDRPPAVHPHTGSACVFQILCGLQYGRSLGG